jgi:hypothetical protein
MAILHIHSLSSIASAAIGEVEGTIYPVASFRRPVLILGGWLLFGLYLLLLLCVLLLHLLCLLLVLLLDLLRFRFICLLWR